MKLRVAIAGAGYIADIHARAINAQPETELAAVVEKFPEKMNAFAAQFGIERRYKTVEELLEDGGVDALVIGTPNYLHAPQTLAALRAGVHVMVEKPMAMNAAEAEEMLATSEASESLLMVAHCWRFEREVVWLREQVVAGRLGEIVRTKGYGVHVAWGPSGWFTERRYAGGGALADMGIHAIDTARYLLGDPQPVSVYARLGTHYLDADVDDTGLILVNWEGGASSYIESGWWQPYADGPEAATHLYGKRGFGQVFPTRLQALDEAGELYRLDPGYPYPRDPHCPQVMYDNQMAYFCDSIREGRKPVPGGMEGLVNMRIIDAIYESSRGDQVIRL
jgi:predicted dehydrogenase